MRLFHTSPEAVITPNTTGTFDEFIFFSDNIYVMTAGEYYVFSTEIDESKIIAATSLWYQDNWEDALEYIRELATRLDISEDDAMDLIDESKDITDLDIDIVDIGEEWWNLQRIAARCAKAMGYIGVRVVDEQGEAYMLDVAAIKLTSEPKLDVDIVRHSACS